MATPLPVPLASSSWDGTTAGPDDDRSLARPREARMGESSGGGAPVGGSASPEYQRWLGQAPRPARVTAALALAVAATALPLLGPVCWAFTERELRAIEKRNVHRRGERAIELARSWAIGATFLAVAAIGFAASFLACRL